MVWRECLRAMHDRLLTRSEDSIDSSILTRPFLSLLHVADGQHELNDNWRIRSIAAKAQQLTMTDLSPWCCCSSSSSSSDVVVPYHTIVHEFQYDRLRSHGVSYLQPCGHPWAALVVFDAVLVKIKLYDDVHYLTDVHHHHRHRRYDVLDIVYLFRWRR